MSAIGTNTRRYAAIAALMIASCAVAASARAEEPSLASAPPVVVATIPQAGATDVAAGATEIKVTFSKPMKAGGWSWSKVSDASFPKLNGQPSYVADRKTAVLPVTLEPGKTYAVWLNLPPAENFTDEQGHKAPTYAIVFSTK
jgi:RNA polymerase sigma-70 factor (ECF subfamily)